MEYKLDYLHENLWKWEAEIQRVLQEVPVHLAGSTDYYEWGKAVQPVLDIFTNFAEEFFEEIERLEQESSESYSQAEQACKDFDKIEDEMGAVRTINKRMKEMNKLFMEMMIAFGKHKENCESLLPSSKLPCTCGFDIAFKQLNKFGAT